MNFNVDLVLCVEDGATIARWGVSKEEDQEGQLYVLSMTYNI